MNGMEMALLLDSVVIRIRWSSLYWNNPYMVYCSRRDFGRHGGGLYKWNRGRDKKYL